MKRVLWLLLISAGIVLATKVLMALAQGLPLATS